MTPEQPVMHASEAPAVSAVPPAVPDVSATPARHRWWLWLLAVAAVGLLAYHFIPRGGKAQAAAKGGKGQQQAPRAVPVLAVAVKNKDVGVYLTGLGSVNPLATVAVRSRVDGQLVSLHFHDGQLVRAGDPLAEIDPRPFQVQLMQAQGVRSKDEAVLQNARVDLKRYQVLAQQDAIPRQQLDTQVAAVRQAEATLQSDQAQIESAKLNLTYSHITAPISGRVGLRMVDPGNMVHAADPNGVVVITQLQPINVLFTLPADQLPQVLGQVHAGQKLPVDAFDRDLKRKLGSGSLLAVDNQIDASTGTVRLKAIFPNADESLFPNQFVNARLLVTTLRGAVVVPTAAVQRSPQSSFVYVVKPDKTVEARNVQIQLTQGDDTVQRGAAVGDVVVIDGLDKLRPGMKVEVSRADTMAAGGPRGGNAPQRTAL
jgi:multidrug efflux system membrane fusion protein